MKKEMLINVLQPEECRIAIVEDGVLEELYVERTSHESYTGNIYKGKIVNLEPAIQAAFVDFSVGRNGFLHVSDVEPQYFERDPGPYDASGPPPRERERKRDPRRDRDRPRGRDDRRRSPAPEPIDPLTEGPAPPPPRFEERPRDRPPNRDRGRDRERPDQSVKGRRDRSERPRRFGEGLVDPADFPVEEPLDLEPPPAHTHLPFEDEPPLASQPSVDLSAPPEVEQEPAGWRQDALWPSSAEPDLGHPPQADVEPEPSSDAPDPAAGWTITRQPEPFDPDLPPSRTERSRAPGAPPRRGETEGRERTRHRVPPALPPELEEWEQAAGRSTAPEPEMRAGRDPRTGRPRQAPPGRPRQWAGEAEGLGSPDVRKGARPEEVTGEPDQGDLGDPDLPPRPRGGRAAIRSRGGNWDRGREPAPPPDVDVERTARPPRAPDEFEPDAGPGGSVDRPAEPERRRPPRSVEGRRGRDRDRDREREPRGPHGRAGEPGYVPRRERQRSPEPEFGAELFPPASDWPDRELEPELPPEAEPHAPGFEEQSDLGFLGDAGPSEAARPEGRRRRRRRGRRRDRERELPKRESTASPTDDLDSDIEDLTADVEPERAYNRGRAPAGEPLDELEFDLDELGDSVHEPLDEDDLAGDEIAVQPRRVADEEIDAELEQEIRREIEEIEELEREIGLRGPDEDRPRRADEPARGGRFTRGRGPAKPPIQEIFRRGDEVLVQVIKESIGTKGPTLSTYISIPGRYLVLMPGLNRVGVSRKIIDEGQRRKLREIMHELNPPKGLGFIVRTAGLERTKRELARDLAYLLRLWKVILRRIKKSKAPTPIYQESDMIIRTIRDIFNSEIDTIWIDEPSAFERAQDFLRVVMPRFVNRLKLYDEKVPLFHKYGIEDEIAKIQRRHVPLPEGGSIVIDQTEALVAIDVNSGNFRVEDDAERTAFEMNLRAAKEIARQLRLRDLGGVIVNDFIDMREERHRRGVERALREAIKRDRARTKVLRMSAFGLIEMTRQRIRPSLKRSIYEDCTHCSGAGVAKTAESMAIDVMRLLALATHREEIRKISVSVNPNVASYLSNRKRKEISRLEAECNMNVQIGFQENAPAELLKIECFDANGNEVRLFPPPAPSHRRGH
jgi:ribonuclease E